LTPLIEAKLQERDSDFWVEILNRNDVPSGAILSLEEAINQDQIKHRGALETIHAEGIGELRLFNLTAKFEKTPASLDTPPPRLSAHTEEILKGLGYTDAQIGSLRQEQAI
jgi:formyl-CoA transferase